MTALTAELNTVLKEAFSECFQQWWRSMWSPQETTLRVSSGPGMPAFFFSPVQRSDTFLTDLVWGQRRKMSSIKHIQRLGRMKEILFKKAHEKVGKRKGHGGSLDLGKAGNWRRCGCEWRQTGWGIECMVSSGGGGFGKEIFHGGDIGLQVPHGE